MVLPGVERLSAAAHGAVRLVLDAIVSSAHPERSRADSRPYRGRHRYRRRARRRRRQRDPVAAISTGRPRSLLGLLLGAVAGLWPFRMPPPPWDGRPRHGRRRRHRDLRAHARTIELKRWPTRSFTPDAPQLASAVGLIAVGFGISIAVGWFGTSARTAGSSGRRRRGGTTRRRSLIPESTPIWILRCGGPDAGGREPTGRSP